MRTVYIIFVSNLKENEQFRDLCVDDRKLIKFILKICVFYFHLDRYLLRATVNMIMNIRVAQETGNFVTRRMTISFSRRILVYITNMMMLNTQNMPNLFACVFFAFLL
jgi:hypothetical protein